MAVYTTIDNPELYFQCKTYTGNGSTQAITFDGSENMQPDFVWCKKRNSAQNHGACDSVRGVQKVVYFDLDAAQATDANSVTAFGTDGFTLGSSGDFNQSSDTYVGWCWKAGGSGSSNSEGDITATVSASTAAGFSLIKFQGNGSTSQSVGHGLNGTPTFWMIKNLTDSSTDFTCYLKAVDRIKLNTTEVMEQNYLMSANSTTVTTPSEAGSTWGNTASKDYMVWVWQQIQGYSAMGKYIGNGNANGPYIHCGFRPSYILGKNLTNDGNHWFIVDNKRSTYNGDSRWLKADYNDAELTNLVNPDFLSNGFKIRNSNAIYNTSGSSYIYIAFAESPFVNSNGVPNNAR